MSKPQQFSNLIDPCLLFSFFGLICISIVMVASASISITEKYNVSCFYFASHHGIYLVISLGCFFILSCVPIKYMETFSIYSALLAIILLSLVFIPGLSRVINGSLRWVLLGPISFQPSEFAKLLIIIYISGYLVRRQENIRNKLSGFLVPLAVILILNILLVLEPDFGTIIVISCITIGLLFIAGIKLRYLIIIVLIASLIILLLVFSSNYRLERIIAFFNPWDNQFDKGYQLVQSLIAFGRGGWFGVGLGSSVQKLLYLPEAYTDFIFAIIAEELGFIGAIVVILLLYLIVIRCLKIAKDALIVKKKFMAYLAYGFAFWVAIQGIINIGVNVGLLPTKGLTLPFISYGGNSLLSLCIGMAAIFRIDFELKVAKSS